MDSRIHQQCTPSQQPEPLLLPPPSTLDCQHLHLPSSTSPTTHNMAGTWTHSHCPYSILMRDENRLIKRQNPQKADGPDSPSTLEHCGDQLSPVFTVIFNTSLETCHMPSCSKASTIIPAQTYHPDLCGYEDI